MAWSDSDAKDTAPVADAPVDEAPAADAPAADAAPAVAEDVPQVAGTPAPAEDAEATPDADDTVAVSIPEGTLAENGEPLVELAVAGLVLKPGADPVEVPRNEAAVVVEDERVDVAEVAV